MNIQEVANSYAEGKANEAITKAIAQAYIDGFNDGYKSGKENVQIECNDTEFIDLGLPSGTLWASDYLRDSEGNVCYLPYVEAAKYSIPSIEQWKELEELCSWDVSILPNNRKIFYCIGLNGNTISFTQTGLIQSVLCIKVEDVNMWLQDNSVDSNKQSVLISSEYIYPKILKKTLLSFCGFKLPIRLVR